MMDRFEAAALDRHITGNHGEDSVPDETAVCNACGWEGVEDEVLEFTTSRTSGDQCPQCKQWEVNYVCQGRIVDRSTDQSGASSGSYTA